MSQVPPQPKSWQQTLLLNLAIWVLMALMWTRGFEATGSSWSERFAVMLLYSTPWAFATLGFLAVRRRFPLTAEAWKTSVPVHLVVTVAWVIVYMMFTTPVVLLYTQGSLGDGWAHTSGQFPWIDGILYWIIVGIAQIVDLDRRYRTRVIEAANLALRNAELESKLTTAQLQTLRVRVQPHFLFNTLNSIVALIRKGEGDAAVKMLVGIGELLRHVTDETGPAVVPVREEMTLLRRYLDIEKVRFGDRLGVSFDIDPATEDALIPNLLVQPLVENAIRHGAAQTTGRTEIRISSHRANGMVRIDVHNDGPPLPDGWDLAAHAGTGLTLTQERVSRTFDTDPGCRLVNDPTGGVTATVEFPFTRELPQ